jgi:hypothetical protein
MTAPTVADLEPALQLAMSLGNWPKVAELEQLLDQAQQRERVPPPPMVSAALWYAQQGLRVFPCLPLDKRPATPNGFLDATTDPEVIASWWAYSGREFNVGIATGHLVDVIDVDPAGVRTWVQMLEDGLELDVVGSATTRRPAGLHFYVPASGMTTDPGDPNSGHAGVDFKGLGGYVIAPPSVVALHAHEVPDELSWQGPPRQIRYRWLRPLELGRWARGQA